MKQSMLPDAAEHHETSANLSILNMRLARKHQQENTWSVEDLTSNVYNFCTNWATPSFYSYIITAGIKSAFLNMHR